MVEIEDPMRVCSASMDTSISIYSIINWCELGKISNLSTPARFLSYTPRYGGNLISVGSENFIHVWCPSIKITAVGKLFGHSNPVCDAKFLYISPHVVSVDVLLNIWLWDIRNLSCL